MSENPILDEMIYEPSSGSLNYKGVRYLMIRPETLASLQRALTSSSGKDVEKSFFEGGFTGGSLSAKKYKEIHDFSDLEVIEFMMKMGSQIGWGHFSLEQYDAKKRHLSVCVANSPFAESYGKSSQGVCHLIRGVLAGMASILFKSDFTSEEIECQAKGDSRCVFVIEGK